MKIESKLESTNVEVLSLPGQSALTLDISVVIPCLNEAKSLEFCVKKAFTAFSKAGLRGEVIVADNGSTDGSIEIAEINGARVVRVAERGYGAALKMGINAARGQYIIMGDADDSYDFSEAPNFVEKLRQGYDLVMGNRFAGGIKPGAMPLLHKYFGNPGLSWLVNLFFGAGVGDSYCGLRGFSRALYDKLDLRSSGMEFALEFVIKASQIGARISEIPIILWPDKRGRPPHLRSFRDGWRSLRFMLMYAPNWLYLVPGGLLSLFGLALVYLAFAWPSPPDLPGHFGHSHHGLWRNLHSSWRANPLHWRFRQSFQLRRALRPRHDFPQAISQTNYLGNRLTRWGFDFPCRLHRMRLDHLAMGVQRFRPSL